MSSTRVRLASLIAAGVLSLTGCADGPDDEDTTPAPTTATPSTSKPAATTEAPADAAETTTARPELSAEEQDEADIEETLLAYVDALNEAYAGKDIEGIYPWSRDAAREQWVTQLMSYEAQGLTFEGGRELAVLEVDVDDDQATVLGCVDYSDTAVFDDDGNEITPEREEGDLILNDFVLEREGSTEYGWVVVQDSSRSEACES